MTLRSEQQRELMAVLTELSLNPMKTLRSDQQRELMAEFLTLDGSYKMTFNFPSIQTLTRARRRSESRRRVEVDN